MDALHRSALQMTFILKGLQTMGTRGHPSRWSLMVHGRYAIDPYETEAWLAYEPCPFGPGNTIR